MGTIQIDGSTPKLTIGNATAEDATILFDGNAQDFYIALDDSADDLLIGLGSTVGTTPAIAIDENLKVNIPVTTASTSASTGSLTTGGGAGIGADLYVGDDAYLITDSAVLGFGADKDTTLTHTDGTGLTLNSTNKLTFGDAASFIHQSGDGVLTIDGEVTIDLNASTAVLVSNDLKLNSDAAVLGFGADNDVTLTHVADTGILLNGTMQLQFNDASQNINAPSATVLDINATDEIELNATDIDMNGILNVSGTITTQSDLNVNDDLNLNSDSAVLTFGADSEVTLTHVHNTGLILGNSSASQLTSVLTIGVGDTADTLINFDGNAEDFRVGLDDSHDLFEIGHGTTPGRYGSVTVDGNKAVWIKAPLTDSSNAEVAGIASMYLKHENASALNVTIADDATITPRLLGSGGCFFVQTSGGGYRGAMFAGSYGSATIVKLSDPTGEFDVAVTDGRIICATSSTNSDIVTLTNKAGSSQNVTVGSIQSLGL